MHLLDTWKSPKLWVRQYGLGLLIVPRFEIESITQISKRWKTLIDDHFTQHNRLPKIESLCWCTNETIYQNMSMRVPEKYRSYFGLKRWFRVLADHYVGWVGTSSIFFVQVVVDILPYLLSIIYFQNIVFIGYPLNNGGYDIDFISKTINRSSSIEKLKIMNTHDLKIALDSFLNFFRTETVHELTIMNMNVFNANSS